MVIIKRNDESKKVYLSKREKDTLKEELAVLYNAGGRNIFVEYRKSLSNYLSIYDDRKNKIGEIVGNSAIILSDLIGKSEDNVFMAVPISINSIIKEYLEED